ncbi:MAG TPA: flagellar protein FlaG [Povalibacter sp.]|nr:flagellar protein FlaG [Povalibacter sp.]
MKVTDPAAPTTAVAVLATPAHAAGAKLAPDSVAAAPVEQLTQSPPPDMSAAVKAAAAQIDSYLQSVGREVEYRIDEETGRTVITVRAKSTGEVIRQIPNEEVLQLAQHFQSGSGVVLDLTV